MSKGGLNSNPTVGEHDPAETQEWREALDAVVYSAGAEHARYLVQQLVAHARALNLSLGNLVNTPYRNTVPLERQPLYPGDLVLEKKLISLVRWNALAMVVRANRLSNELGGHIASYASAAELFEVGFNHFFRACQGQIRGDLVYFQAHSAPGIYARAYLEGRIPESALHYYRRELAGKTAGTQGLSSYPHPWLMPDFWQFPTGSMGLGPINAIYQARFMRYLEHRGLLETQGRKVWGFFGDGEMDEPESVAALTLAGREQLDNLVFVINCNLQRLDGPVRGNGQIIQELESLFAGAGWNVVKIVWGSGWDALFARDTKGHLLARMEATVDGQYQTYKAKDGTYGRRHFFGVDPVLESLVSHLSDAEIEALERGGHDVSKIYAGFSAAANHRGQPTVVLAKTVKGYGMGKAGQGQNTTHQQKKLEIADLKAFRDRFDLPLSDEQVEALSFYRPADDSPEMLYLQSRRQSLGGYLPVRTTQVPSLPVPALQAFERLLRGSQGREMSSTVALVQQLTQLIKDPQLGARVVPIVADEARTFGMQALFRQIGIYAPMGQLYEPEDLDTLMYYREEKNGQILEEGITEAGAMASWIAAATSYANHGIAMLPVYIYYSMFGFQRVGDLIWAAADMSARGFLIGATSGRTTLSGEGLQHQDGSSQLIAATIPNCCAYDPCFGFEVAVIVQRGASRMLEQQENVFYYLTVSNQVIEQYPMPDCVEEGILKGLYLLRAGTSEVKINLLGSGALLVEALAAAELLESIYGLSTHVWSVTSYSELARNGRHCERLHRLYPEQQHVEMPWVTRQLSQYPVPVVAVSDYVCAVPDSIRAFIPSRYVTLGTDGFGRSDTRAALRDFFEVDRWWIAYSALATLVDEGLLALAVLLDARVRWNIDPQKSEPMSQ